MSESDLRAPERGMRPQGSGRFMLAAILGTKQGLLGSAIVIGFLLGVGASTFNGISSGRIAPTESNIPRMQAALRPVLQAFYTTPSNETQAAAVALIRNFRQAFPDALPDTLQAPSEKLSCVEGPDCRIKRRDQQEEHFKISASLSAKIAQPLGSVPYHAEFAEAMTVERRLPVQMITGEMERYRKQFDAAKDASTLLHELTNGLDKVAQSGVSQLSYQEAVNFRSRFMQYTGLANESGNRFYFEGSCSPPNDFSRPYVAACTEAVAAYKEQIQKIERDPFSNGRVPPDWKAQQMTARINALKIVMTERRAPRNLIADQLYRVLMGENNLAVLIRP